MGSASACQQLDHLTSGVINKTIANYSRLLRLQCIIFKLALQIKLLTHYTKGTMLKILNIQLLA